MKIALSIIFICVAIFVFARFSSATDTLGESRNLKYKETNQSTSVNAVNSVKEHLPSFLVVYYSYSKNTESVAKRIAALIDADLYEIRTKKAYPSDPFKTSEISNDERKSDKLPELVDDLPNISDYDVIFVGSPIWNGYMSTPLESYFKQTDFSGKTIVPFCTSMGSGEKGYLSDLKDRAKDPKKIGELINIQFPANAQPNAFTEEELDEKLKTWIAPYISNQESKNMKLTKDSTVKLNSGYEIPLIGFGTWALTGETCKNAVYTALKEGYRHIDTARYYSNHKEIGIAVRKAIDEGIVKREELFITTKIIPSGDRDYRALIDQSNRELGLDYIDLLLVHQRGVGEKKLYSAIEESVKAGIVRSIGISNYYTEHEFNEITKGQTIMPAVVQNENHIYYQNTDFQQYVSQYGTIVESWYPFGGRGRTLEAFNNETIKIIAKAHKKSPAQVILRWHLQAGYIVLPGSSNPNHIADNINIFDFELSEDEMQQIKRLNTNNRYEHF